MEVVLAGVAVRDSAWKNSSQANSAERPAALTIAGALRAVTGSPVPSARPDPAPIDDDLALLIGHFLVPPLLRI